MTAVARQPSTGGQSGLLSGRPAAAAGNAGGLYLATDDTTDGPNGTLWNSNGSTWSVVPKTLHGVFGWFWMKDFGADLTGVSDTTAAFNTIVGLLDTNRAGTIYLSQGKYYTATGYVCRVQGASIVGEGQTGISDDLTSGSTQIIVGNGAVGLTIGSTTVSHFRGYHVSNVHFYEKNAGQALGGMLLQNVCDSTFDRVAAGRFTAGYGIKVTGLNGCFPQYNTFTDCRIGRCLYGYQQDAAIGTRWIGGQGDGGQNGVNTPLANSIGWDIISGDSFRAVGTLSAGFDTLWRLGGQLHHELTGIRCEFWSTSAFHILSGSRRARIQATGDNSLIAGGGTFVGTGVIIDSGALDTDISAVRLENVRTVFSDSGTRTIYPTPPPIVKAGVVGDADYYAPPGDITFAVDTTNKHLQVRAGGVWNYIDANGLVQPVISRVKRLGSSAPNVTSVTTVTRAVTGPVPAGHHVLVGFGYGLGSTVTVTVTDARGNTYATDIHADKLTNNTPHSGVASAKITTPLQTGDLITVTFSSAVNHPLMTCVEYANLATASWLDQATGASGSSTAPSSGNITTTIPQSLTIGAVCWQTAGATYTPAAGWTQVSDLIDDGTKGLTLQEQTNFVTATLAATGVISSSSDWAMAVADYKSA